MPIVRDEISVLLNGKSAGGGEDVGRMAHKVFIMFTFASPLILAGVLSTGMSILRLVRTSEMKPQRTGSDATDCKNILPVEAVIEALGQVELPQQEVGDFIAALSARYPSVLRCRRDVVDSELPFPTDPIKWYRWGRRSIDVSVRPSRCLAYAAADYYLQDAASLLALAACGCDQDFKFDTQQPGGPVVCDLCASPGGKASALLEAIGSSGYLLANEPIRSRVAPLAFNLARTGYDRFAISSLDPEVLASTLGGVFDLVVIDAPCSGQALLGRGKQSVSALSPHQIAHRRARQQRILAAATNLLKPGGPDLFTAHARLLKLRMNRRFVR